MLRFFRQCVGLTLVLAALVGSESQRVFAQGFQAKMTELSTRIPSEILESGRKKVRNWDLQDLLKKLRSVRWTLNSSNAFLAGSGEQRGFAIYLAKEHEVVVNSGALKITDPEILPLISLHEGLGAAGYDDENYALSLALAFACPRIMREHGTEIGEALARDFDVPALQKGDRLYVSTSGGGSSVGGGGDGTAIAIKFQALWRAGTWLSQAHGRGVCVQLTLAGFLRRIATTDFEVSFRLPSADPLSIERQAGNGGRLIRVNQVDWMSMKMRQEDDSIDRLFDRILAAIAG